MLNQKRGLSSVANPNFPSKSFAGNKKGGPLGPPAGDWKFVRNDEGLANVFLTL